MKPSHAKIINDFRKSPNDHNMGKLVSLASSNKFSIDDIAYLAKIIAQSGELIEIPSRKIAADIPSTGGPSSLSTLICPLVLTEFGYVVPKLAVPGRPAGGIDVLSQIKNYKIEFTNIEISKCLDRNGYCHFLVGNRHTPLDDVLFRYRTKNNAKAIPSLVIASILAKKISSGLKYAGLDVRVSKYGNFGITWDEARRNSEQFIEVANKVGIKATCFLNEANDYQQPYIGRGESLLALNKIFNETDEGLLKDHLNKCIDMAIQLSKDKIPNYNTIHKKLKINFQSNLEAQNSNWKYFLLKIEVLKSESRYELFARKKGYLKIELDKIRDAIVQVHSFSAYKSIRFPDTCGVIFYRKGNDFVNIGDAILSYRAPNKMLNMFRNNLKSSVSITNYYNQSSDYEIIR